MTTDDGPGGHIFGPDHVADELLGEPDDEELERLRSFCAMLPETAEIDGLGHPTFRVATKAFAIYELVDERPMACLKVSLAQQAELVGRDGFAPEPHTGEHGWTLVPLDGRVHWDEIDELVIDSYRLVAPSEYVAQLDALLGPP